MRLLMSLSLLTLLSCSGLQSVNQRCVKGRFIAAYCEGVVIQVLDAPIGRNWQGPSDYLTNCVVANLDTLSFQRPTIADLPKRDSIFYFQYREGGYPQKQYILCHPAPFITITAASATGCQ
jgi:hypothetical protein